MRRLLEIALGVPVSKPRVRAEVELFVGARDVHAVRSVMNENITHITGKSGALLQAQGIFVVVGTYALDRGWPPALVLSSMLLLIIAALAVMTNLRSIYIGLDATETANERAEFENVVRTAELAAWRAALFNVALYMTFLSILLLGIGAVVLELGRNA
jgi:hypothetical protein